MVMGMKDSLEDVGKEERQDVAAMESGGRGVGVTQASGW